MNPSVLEKVQDILFHQGINEGFITGDTFAIDASHFEVKDKAYPKEEKLKTEPKKRGRKSKEVRENYLIVKSEFEANLSLHEKKIED